MVPSDQKVLGGEYYREPKPSSEFAARMAARNEQLDELGLPRLQIEELCAARLFTGPMVFAPPPQAAPPAHPSHRTRPALVCRSP